MFRDKFTIEYRNSCRHEPINAVLSTRCHFLCIPNDNASMNSFKLLLGIMLHSLIRCFLKVNFERFKMPYQAVAELLWYDLTDSVKLCHSHLHSQEFQENLHALSDRQE